MKIISITGGKGGVGKSTFSVLLANKLISQGKKVVLADCDVECPNDYLLLGEKLNHSKGKVFANFPKLDKSKCQKCGLCAQNCRSNAIFQSPGRYPEFLKELCSGCSLCWNICPQKAIGIQKKLTGEIYINDLRPTTYDLRLKNLNIFKFLLITTRSVGIVDESGPIVTQAKKYALNLAKKIKADYLLIDTAVGMHCGVIRALINCGKIYAVTEPTPLGAHDLDLILQLIKKLKISVEAVINQADLGDRKLILKIIKKYKLNIAYKIPYSKKIVDVYSQGKLKEVNIL